MPAAGSRTARATLRCRLTSLPRRPAGPTWLRPPTVRQCWSSLSWLWTRQRWWSG